MQEKLPVPPAHDGAAWTHAMPVPIHRRHHHAELELNLVTTGTGRYLVEDRTHELKAGTLIWLFPGQQHILLDMSRDFRMWILVFRPRLLRRLCRDATRRVLLAAAPTGDFCRQLSETRRRKLERQYQELGACRHDPVHLNASLACALLDSWATFLAAHEPALSSDLHPAVQKAARLLRASPEVGDLGALARQAGLSRTRLSELFRRQTGVSLVEFRSRTRLEKFHELHDAAPADRRKLLALALEAGFGSYQQFFRVYKRATGRGPRAGVAPSERNYPRSSTLTAT